MPQKREKTAVLIQGSQNVFKQYILAQKMGTWAFELFIRFNLRNIFTSVKREIQMPNRGLHPQITRPSLESRLGAPGSEWSHLESQMGLFSHVREIVQLIGVDISQVSLLGELSELRKEQFPDCLAVFAYLLKHLCGHCIV